MRYVLTCLVVALAGSAVRAGENDLAVETLVKQLKSPDSDLRREAAKKLGEFGKDAQKAAPALVQAIKADQDLFVQRFAAQSLGQIEADPKLAIPALAGLLKEGRKELTDAAINALGKMGPEAVPALSEILKKSSSPTNKKGPQTVDRGAFLRARAAQALGQIGPDAKSAVPALIDALRDPSVRIDAATALGNIGPAANQAVNALREAVTDRNARRDRAFADAVNKAIRKIEQK